MVSGCMINVFDVEFQILDQLRLWLTWHMLGGCPRAGGQPLQQAAFLVEIRGVHVEVAQRGSVGEQLLLRCARDRGLPCHHPLLQHVLACTHNAQHGCVLTY